MKFSGSDYIIFSWTDTTYKQMPIFSDHKYNWIAECVYGRWKIEGGSKKYTICLQDKRIKKSLIFISNCLVFYLHFEYKTIFEVILQAIKQTELLKNHTIFYSYSFRPYII